jgi:hypothetical protein
MIFDDKLSSFLIIKHENHENRVFGENRHFGGILTFFTLLIDKNTKITLIAHLFQKPGNRVCVCVRAGDGTARHVNRDLPISTYNMVKIIMGTYRSTDPKWSF